MQQQTVFPIMSVQNDDQAKLAKDLSVITNILGMGVIEIELRDPRVRELQGIMVCSYKEYHPMDEELLQTTGAMNTAQRYPNKILGGTLKFVMNPYARMPLATGRVAFLIDDKEDTPLGAMSGIKKGWNREFLAAHFMLNGKNTNDDMWIIVDDAVRKDIEARHASIVENIKRMQSAPVEPDQDPNAIPFYAQEQPGPVDDPGVGRVQGSPSEVDSGMGGELRSVLGSPLPTDNSELLRRLESIEAENATLRQKNESLSMAIAGKGNRGITRHKGINNGRRGRPKGSTNAAKVEREAAESFASA